ncbi:MAG TPA: hypothetical protein VLB29_12265 [Nocardioidaceae bacterium]|nr:hypothetical protein [Nocardioidaceae bacterium]
MSTRVYVPCSLSRLRGVLVSGGVGPVPILAHAVTDDVRSALADLGEEEWEYAVLTAAAQDSLGLIGEDDTPRRVVLVAEAESVSMLDGAEGSVVEIDEVLPLRKIVAVHVDSEDAVEAVSAARDAWAAADAGDAEAARIVERCADHELGWFATQEIGELVEE